MLPSVAVSCPLRQSCHVAQAGIKLKILPHPPWCWNRRSNAPDSADSPQYPLPFLQSNHVQTPRHQRSSIYVQRNKDQAFWESQASLFPTDGREHFSNSMGSRNCSHGVKSLQMRRRSWYPADGHTLITQQPDWDGSGKAKAA